jgi:hemerythrin-like metal-binding protein
MVATIPTFRWTERYSVKIAVLDQQHQRLFATINELQEALAHGNGAAVVEGVLQRLVNYVVSHFASEEALLAEYKYPATASHRAEHNKFSHSVAKFLADHRSGRPGVPVSLILFLQDWLKEHILINDKAYVDFLNARGVR